MEEELEQEELPHVVPLGQQFKDARRAKGLEIDDIAATTRIPKRHLENLEAGNFAALPAPTYTMGFAKSYARELDMDVEQVSAQLREEMDGFAPRVEEQAGFEPVDPNRSMPKWLIWGALLALIAAIIFFIVYSERSLLGAERTEPPALSTIGPETEEASAETPPTGVTTAQRVMLMADSPVWVRITDGGETLVETELGPDNSYTVPLDATAPMLETVRPEALRILVGRDDAPQVGPDGERVAGISLLPPDLMRGPQAAAPTQAASQPAAAAPRSTRTARRASAPPQVETQRAAPAQPTPPPAAPATEAPAESEPAAPPAQTPRGDSGTASTESEPVEADDG